MSVLQTLVDAIALGMVYALVAMGIGLVFGVMRLVNFAHGELITAGAYALLLTNDLPLVVGLAACFGAVIALALAMEVVYRPLDRDRQRLGTAARAAAAFSARSN